MNARNRAPGNYRARRHRRWRMRVIAAALSLGGLLVVWGSSLIRSRLSYSLWRRLHPLALAALGLVMLHALFAGTDGPALWLRAGLVVVAVTVACLFIAWMRLKLIL